MALWSIKRIEAGAVNPSIGEAPIQVIMIDKDTGTLSSATIQATYDNGKLDVTPTLQTITDSTYWPNDWGGTPTP